MTGISNRQRARSAFAALGLALAAATACGAENPIARHGDGVASSTAPIDGAWNGANLERRSGCAAAQNDGSRGTYAQFNVSTDPLAKVFGITEIGVTGLTCNYYGDYQVAGAERSSTGSYSCSDGKTGTYRSRSMLVTDTALSIHLDIQLTGTESCAIEAVIGGSRFYP
jgi:hypothetical protein